jgi:hypothetical protein
MMPCAAMAQSSPAQMAQTGWDDIPAVAFKGGQSIYWNVYSWDPDMDRQALARGFRPISLADPYANRADGAKFQISGFTSAKTTNPWVKPPDFERIIRADTARVKNQGMFVQDIEIEFDENASRAWNDPVARAASGAATLEAFREAYDRAWATWYADPLKWTREIHPGAKLGLYGRQPFQRDYWGIAQLSPAALEQKHARDLEIWKHIDPHVDHYIVDIYQFYSRPESVHYMAANVELNYARTRAFGSKPVTVYTWMRYHDSNAIEKNRELDPFLVEAMAAVPFFSGATNLVLWGHEPNTRPGTGQPYQQLSLFMKTLARVAALSDKMAAGRLVIDTPAQVLWQSRKPLVRRYELGNGECVFLAVNPWQLPTQTGTVETECAGQHISLGVNGRHVTLAASRGGDITFH